MGWWIAYVALLAALVVRFRDPAAAPREVPPPSPTEPLRLVGLHHALFFALFVLSALEAMIARATVWRALGMALFAAGVLAYRVAGSTLGDALSPFVEPAPGAGLVTRGLYRFVRHPMYLGQAMIAFGAPLTLGCRWTLAVSAAALLVLMARIGFEEAALRRTYPEYAHYAAHSKRILPFLF